MQLFSQSSTEHKIFGVTLPKLPDIVLRLIRFALVGGIATMIYAVLTYWLIQNQMNTVAASVLGYAVAIPFSFIGQKYFTFNAEGRVPVEFTKFLLTQGIGMFCAAVIMGMVTKFSPESPLIGIAAVVVAIPLMNFFIMTLWIFPQRNRRK